MKTLLIALVFLACNCSQVKEKSEDFEIGEVAYLKLDSSMVTISEHKTFNHYLVTTKNYKKIIVDRRELLHQID